MPQVNLVAILQKRTFLNWNPKSVQNSTTSHHLHYSHHGQVTIVSCTDFCHLLPTPLSPVPLLSPLLSHSPFSKQKPEKFSRKHSLYNPCLTFPKAFYSTDNKNQSLYCHFKAPTQIHSVKFFALTSNYFLPGSPCCSLKRLAGCGLWPA